MTGFVDIHSHLLPGIDDGPETLDGSLAMARAAAAAGTAVLAATPHLHASFPNVHIEEVGERVQRMQAAIDEAGIELQVVPAAETSLLWAIEASDEQLRLATYGQRGADLLVETPNDVSMIEQLLYQVRARGVRVTLAHPERSDAFRRDPERLARLHEQGILLQVNASGLLRRRSEGARLIEHLAREGLATVVSSDGHRGAEWRPVGALADGVAALDELVGPERALWMARDAPAAIIAGQPIPTPPVVVQPARGVFRRRGRGVAGGVGKEPEHAPTIRPAPALPPGLVVLPAQEAGEERPRSERLRYLVLIPLLAVAVVSFVFVRLKQGEGQPLIVAQRHAQTLTPSAVARVVRVAPDPVIRRAGVAARCASSGSGVLRNPWRCRIRYPSGRVIGYRVTINADGSYVGNDELVRYHGRQFHDTGTIGGCCISIP